MILNLTDAEVDYMEAKLLLFNELLNNKDIVPYYGMHKIVLFEFELKYEFQELKALEVGLLHIWMEKPNKFVFEIENYQQFIKLINKIKFKALLEDNIA